MEGDAVASPVAALDIGRLRDDTGYAPQFDATAGILDYVAWLRNGNSH
jgi:UDP-glucose 4-epimerase